VTTKGDPGAAPLPRRGTAAYRRRLLEASASEDYDGFEQAMEALWPTYGWRLTVDMGTEMLANLDQVVASSSPYRDSFGRVALKRLLPRMDEAEQLDNILLMASDRVSPDLPPHERFAQAMASGMELESLIDKLMPTWQQALDAMRTARLKREPGAAVLTAFLCRFEDRDDAAWKVAFVQHCYLRQLCLPRGDRWVEGWAARPVPELSAQAVYDTADPLLADRLLPDIEPSGSATEGRRSRGRRGAACKKCGKVH
jgi:hypothetical protein